MGNTLVYQIDRTLQFFALHHTDLQNGEIFTVGNINRLGARKMITQTFQELDASDFYIHYDGIIDKLIEDGFIKELPEQETQTGFVPEKLNITFKGRFWLEQNGYQGESDRNHQTEIRNRNSYVLNLILAIATGGYLFFEIYKFCFEHKIVFVCP